MSRHRQARACRCTESPRSSQECQVDPVQPVGTEVQKTPGTGKARVLARTASFHVRNKNGEAPRACTRYIVSTVFAAAAGRASGFPHQPIPPCSSQQWCSCSRPAAMQTTHSLSRSLTHSVTGHCRCQAKCRGRKTPKESPVVGGTTIGPPDWVQRRLPSSRHPHLFLGPLDPSCTPGSFSFSLDSGEPHTWACSSQARVPWG